MKKIILVNNNNQETEFVLREQELETQFLELPELSDSIGLALVNIDDLILGEHFQYKVGENIKFDKRYIKEICL